MYLYLWNTYGSIQDMPNDAVIRSHLVLDKKFNEAAVPGFIKDYKSTLEYAKLGQDDKIRPLDESSEDEVTPLDDLKDKVNANIGDLIQWTSNGVDQLNPLGKVRAIHESGDWIFIDGSETGIPMNEATVMESAPQGLTQLIAPPTMSLPAVEAQSDKGSRLIEKADEEVFMANYLSKREDNPVSFRLLVKGDLGVGEIGKLIKLLEAQKLILED